MLVLHLPLALALPLVLGHLLAIYGAKAQGKGKGKVKKLRVARLMRRQAPSPLNIAAILPSIAFARSHAGKGKRLVPANRVRRPFALKCIRKRSDGHR